MDEHRIFIQFSFGRHLLLFSVPYYYRVLCFMACQFINNVPCSNLYEPRSCLMNDRNETLYFYLFFLALPESHSFQLSSVFSMVCFLLLLLFPLNSNHHIMSYRGHEIEYSKQR